MMRRIVAGSLQFRLLVVPIAAVMMFVGVAQLRTMPVDVLPEFMPVSVEIQTEALGLSAVEVEQLVTVPMEQDLLNGVAWLAQIRSESVPGLSSIELIFQPGTDILRARQMVQERLTQAHALPHVSKPPVMLQPLSSTSRVMMIGLSSRDLSLIDMSVLARWKIRPRLMGVPGVANVAIWGQRERQLQVQVDPERLSRYGISLNQVIRTTGNALWVSPLTFVEASTPGTGGFIDTPNQRLPIRHVLPITTPGDLARVPIEGTQDMPLLLGDVATVVEDHQPLIGDAVVNGGPGLMLVVEKSPGSNTLEVSRQVDAALDTLRPGLKGLEMDTTVFRPATFIETAVGNLSTTLLLALILVIAFLLLALILVIAFFGASFVEWRTALISLVAIPLSLLTAALVLQVRGGTFNMMILAGLVLALVVIIDDAIVDIDNIKRRLRQRREEGSERSAAAVVLDAALEARGPILYGTLIIVAAAVPLFFLDGLTGAFSRPLALTYVLAVLASFVVAMTVTPALALLFFAKAPLTRRTAPVVRALQRGYAALMNRFINRSRWALLAAAAVVLAGLVAVPQLGSLSLVPSLQDRNLLIKWDAAPGTSRQEMIRIVQQASAELRSVPGVRTVGAHVGRAVTSDQVVNVNSGQVWVSIDPTADYQRTMDGVQRVVDGYPGFERDVGTYPEQQMREVLTGTGERIVVRVFGKDLGVLRNQAEEVRRLLSGINGIVEPKVDLQAEEPTVEVEVNLAAAQRYGLKPGDVRRAAATLISGLEVGNLFEEQKVFEVVVWGAPTTRNSLTSIRELLIDTPSGTPVRLKDVAEVRVTPNPTVIKHDGVSRRVDVTADVSGRDVGSAVAEINERLKGVSFPLEYHAEVLGEYAEQGASRQRSLAIAVAAAIAIFLLLQAAFGSWRLAALFFLTLPIALAGGALAAFVAGGVTSQVSFFGYLAVLGLAARNGIQLIRHYQRLEKDEGEKFGLGLVIRGTQDRLAPILTTAVLAGLALLPFVIVGGVPGQEVVRPIAIVILGGLVTSTLLNLFIMPALYLRFAAERQPADLAVTQTD